MKKLILGVAVFAMVFVACDSKKSADSVVGSWVMPIEGQPGKMQGIKLEEGGEASSINMATLVYKYWAVSYTHLDVYKRQISCCRFFTRFVIFIFKIKTRHTTFRNNIRT